MRRIPTIIGSASLAIILIVWYVIRSRHSIPDDRSKHQLSAPAKLQSGDIIFQSSRSSQSKAVQLATHSPYSHMGIVFQHEGQLYVYEAVQPVKLTKLMEWIQRGENEHYIVKRLKNVELLTQENLTKMMDFGKQFMGKGYDLYFEWSDDKIYCSELVWKIYKGALGIEIGKLQTLNEFDLSSRVVKDKLKERYGNKIPLNENVISPAAIFSSDKLITIEAQ